MSGNMAFFDLVAFYLVAFYLVALYLVALYLVALPGGSTWCINVLYLAPLCTIITPYQPSQNKMGQSFEIVVMIKKDSTNTMQINGLRYVK